jgi:hypothetical protein
MTRAVGKLVGPSRAGDDFMADTRGMGADLRYDKLRVKAAQEASRKLLLRLRRKHPGGDPYAVPMPAKVLRYAQTRI